MPHEFNTIQYIHNGSGKRNEKGANGRHSDRKRETMITYGDNIVLMTRSEVELKGMMKRFKRYIDKKRLTLSAGKSKVVVFEKRRERTKRRE